MIECYEESKGSDAIDTPFKSFANFFFKINSHIAFKSGALSTQQYYQQLLRLVYRLIFLFVAEDRDLLLLSSADARTRERYAKHYSLNRIRRLAERRRGTRHADLWQGIRLIFGLLDRGDPRLGLPALGSVLFSAGATPDLDGCELANDALLEAIRHLAFTQEDKVLRQVDYRNLGSEEFGSVYESLLELHPDVNTDAARFELATVAGSERKTTGSYYTPSSLINCLLDSALDPVVEERLKDARRLANGQWRTDEEKHYAYSVVSGSRSLAAGHEAGGAGVSDHKGVSERRSVRHDQPDPAGRLFDTGEHRRGLGSSQQQGVPAVPPDRAGQPARAGDPPAPGAAGRTGQTGSDPAAASGDHDPEQTVAGAHAEPDHAKGERRFAGRGDWQAALPITDDQWSRIPLATRHVLLAEKALLSLKVCDPACGSGHFLIAAANRLAHRLATVRTGDDEPSPEARRSAFRDVVGRCIYGVDLNDLALEITKAALWLEAFDANRPLPFLDAHFRAGNSLLGTTPALLKQNIPDSAFAVLGDDLTVRGGVYFSCVARGESLFGSQGAELDIIRHNLGDVPLIGMYGNGEIARNRVYGYTGVLTLFV